MKPLIQFNSISIVLCNVLIFQPFLGTKGKSMKPLFIDQTQVSVFQLRVSPFSFKTLDRNVLILRKTHKKECLNFILWPIVLSYESLNHVSQLDAVSLGGPH